MARVLKPEQRARIAAQLLAAQYPQPEVPLHHKDAFTLLVAVALSARCTDARVNKISPALFERYPDAASMAQAEPDEVRPYIASCGLAESKAHKLVHCARQLIEKHHGEVPRNFEELEALSGVGHKTASVVMNQAFGQPAFPVDTHIYRLARRWGLSTATKVQGVERDLKALYAPEDWGQLHLRMILWGREHCKARGCEPPCAICEQLRVQ